MEKFDSSMKKTKVVIIAYLIYPQNSPRSNRATELAKEFGRQDYDVTLYGVLGNYDYTDFETKYNVKVKDLGKHLFCKDTSDGINQRASFISKVVARTIGRFIYYPHIYLSKLVDNALRHEKDIDLLISIAYPFPIHWGVAQFKSNYPDKMKHTTWIADCGDPFMGNPFSKHPFYFKNIEKWFCEKTDYLTVPIEEAKEAYYPEFRHKIEVIPQGFNMDEFKAEGLYKRNEVPTFIYAGVFYQNIRDPQAFLDYLVKKEIDFKFIVYTKSKALIEPYKDLLGNKLEIKDYVPRIQLLEEMSKADFLLNIENNTNKQSPSKLIDYALTKRPILNINSNEFLNEKLVDDFLSENYSGSMKIVNIEQYDIKNILAQFVSLKKEKE